MAGDRLGQAFLRRSYQLITEVDTVRYGAAATFERVADLLYAWATVKGAPGFFVPRDRQTLSLNDRNTGAFLGVIDDRDAHLFTLRYLRPDRDLAGRFWITETELAMCNGVPRLAVKSSVNSLDSYGDESTFHRPSFVSLIAENIGLRDGGQRLMPQVWELTDNAEVGQLVALLTAPERRLPVVLISECTNRDDGFFDGYALDGDVLVQPLLGAAHFVRIKAAQTYELTRLVTPKWTTFDGAVRIYYPDFSLQNSDRRNHPYTTKWDIELGIVNGEVGPSYADRLLSGLRAYNTRRLDWSALGFQFYFTTQQKRLIRQREKHEQSVEEMCASYEAQIEQLQAESRENLSLSASYATDADNYKNDCAELRSQVASLKAQVETLRYQVVELTGDAESKNVPTSGSYTDIKDWVDRYFPDRIYLHPRAIRSLKDAAYDDIALVYRCLILLATDYHELRRGLITREEFERRCRAVDSGLEEGGAVTEMIAEGQGDTYFVDYACQRRKLERHLGKGNSRDPKHCLRIYFFWDDESQLVVVGSLPQHLDNHMT